MNEPKIIDTYYQVQEQSKRGHPNYNWSNVGRDFDSLEGANMHAYSLSPSRKRSNNIRIVKRVLTEEVVA